MKKLFKFFCLMAAIMVGQMAWAQSSSATTFRWSSSELNSISQPAGAKYDQFVKTTSDGLLTVTIKCNDHKVAYKEDRDWSVATTRYLTIGHIDPSQIRSGLISWKSAQTGYQIQVDSVETETKIAGSKCYYSLNGGAEQDVDVLSGLGWVYSGAGIADPSITSIPYYFRGGSKRVGENLGEGALLNAISMWYHVYPSAPIWVDHVQDMYVTVDTTNIHWYCPGDSAKALASYFDPSVKVDVELTKGNEKYLFWNEEHTKFYMLKPMEFAFQAYIVAEDGKHLGSDTIHVNVSAKYPQEQPQIFFYVDDEWVRDINEDGNNFVNLFVTMPVEHFVEYICADKSEVEYIEKTETSLTYMDKVRDRRDHFWMKEDALEGSGDNLTVKIGNAQSTLRINALGMERNRVPFVLDSANQASLIVDVDDAGWKDHYVVDVPFYDFEKDSCLFFEYEYLLSAGVTRYANIAFVGVPDSVFFDYGNDAGSAHEDCVFKAYYATSESGDTYTELITINDQPSGDVHCAFALPLSANRLRFTYTGVQHPGWVKNLKVTEKKVLDILPQDTLINFGTHLRKLNVDPVAIKDSLAWVNLFPEILTTIDEPFSAKNHIHVRLDQWDTIRSHNHFKVMLDLDTVGVFSKRLKVASMDVAQPMAAYVTVNGIVTYDVEDMFAKVNGKDADSIHYGDTAYITIQDGLKNILKHDSLIVSYDYNTDSLKIDENGKITDVCVGGHVIVVNTAINTLVPLEWHDTLYLFAQENEIDTISFFVPEEVAVHDTLDFAKAFDSEAKLSYEFEPAGCMSVLEDGRLLVGSNTYADSVTVTVTASQTCEHFQQIASQKVWIRGIVHPKFNPSIPWMTNVFGGDTLVEPFYVLNEAMDAKITDRVNVKMEFDPNDVVDSLADGSFYLKRSHEDSLTINVVVASDSIKTAKTSIKFPVREYTVAFTFPLTVDDRGYYYVGDTLMVSDFRVTATNPEREGLDLTHRVNWNKYFEPDNALDGHVDENGNVVIDSIAPAGTKLVACVDTSFVKSTCDSRIIYVKPAVVDQMFFPGVEGIYTVGDSIAVKDIVVLDTAARDISRYVRYTFNYVPEDFAHRTPNALPDNDFIVLDKNGLDTTAVDTLISLAGGPLVVSKNFKYRLLIAPVYAVNMTLPTYDYSVGDTLYAANVKAFDAKGNDVTRYSSFVLVAADSIAHEVEGGIVLDKAGDVKVKIVAKRNESMHQGSFTAVLHVAPVKVNALMHLVGARYEVFDHVNTNIVRFVDAKGNDITHYATMSFTYAGQPVEGDFVLEHAGNYDLVATIVAGNVADTTLVMPMYVNKYEQAKVVKNTKPYVVGDEMPMRAFRVVDADNKPIAKSYYTLSYNISENDAHFNLDSTRLTLDSLATDVEVLLHSEDIALADAAQFTINADPCTAARIELPSADFFVGEGFAVADIKVYDAHSKDITVYAKNEFTGFAFSPNANAHMNATNDSIYFDKAKKVTIKTFLGTLLVNAAEFETKMLADQVLVDKIDFPAGPFAVGDTILASQCSAFVGEQDVTRFIEDLVLMIDPEDGHIIEGGIVLDKKGNITIAGEVLGRSAGENYKQMAQISVDPIMPTSFVLPQTEFTVLDGIQLDAIKFYKGEVEITQYVDPAYVFNVDSAHFEEGAIVLDMSGKLTIKAQAYGNATGEVSQVIDVKKYKGAVIVNSKEAEPMEIGDVLTPEDFYLTNAAGDTIVPRYATIVLSSPRADRAHMEGVNFVFDKATDVTIVANVEGQVEAAQYSKLYEVEKMTIADVVFPKYQYLVGDSIAIADLRLMDANGNDVTDTYGKGAFMGFEFGPNKDKSAQVANGYIYLKQPGVISVTSIIANDSVNRVMLTDEIYSDLLTADRVEFPADNFIVGDELKNSDIKIYAGARDITEFSNIILRVDEGYAHYVEEGVVFDQKDVVRVYAEIGGFGVYQKVEFFDFHIAPIEATAIEGLNSEYTVFDRFDTKSLVVKADDRDITNYAELSFAFNNDNARLEDGIIYFDKAGAAELTVTVAGNATGSFVLPITINKQANVSISFKGGNYYVADEVLLSDFMIVDAAGKPVPAEYSLSIRCDAARGTKVGDNIVLDKAGQTTITATLADNEKIAAEEAEFVLNVNRANPGVVIYPSKPYIVSESMNVSEFIVRDTVNRDITKYAAGAFMDINFDPADAASYAAGEVSFLKPGKVEVTAVVGNDDIAPKQIKSFWAIEQLVATSLTYEKEDFIVGETMELSNVKVFAGEQDITSYTDLYYAFTEGDAHKAENGAIVFDKQGNISVNVIIVGQSGVARQIETKVFTVAPIVATAIEGLNSEYTVFDRFDTKSLVVKADDRDITNYAELSFALNNDNARLEDGIIYFDKAGAAELTVTVAGNATGSFVLPITINKQANVSISFKGGNYYVADEVLLSDFMIVDADGKPVPAEYSLSIRCDAARGTKVGDNIVLDKAGQTTITATLADNEKIAADEAEFVLNVNRANPGVVIYPSKPYIVSESMNVSEFIVRDTVNRDITKYAAGAFMDINFDPADAASYAAGEVSFLKPGKVEVTAVVGNDDIAPKQIKSFWAIEQLVATSLTYEKEDFIVGETMELSNVKVFAGEQDITSYTDLYYAFTEGDAHKAENGAIVFDKQGNISVNVIIVGQSGAGRLMETKIFSVAPVAVAEVVLPRYSAEVLDTLDTKDVIVLDAAGNDITHYASISYQFDNEAAKMMGTKIVFYKHGDLTLNVSVTGNAAGEFAPVVKVVKNSLADITMPVDDWYVGDKIHLDQFDLVDVNGKKFDAEYSLSFDIFPTEGRKLDDNTIVFDEAGAVKVYITVEGETTLTGKSYEAHVKQCIADRVVFPKVDYIVGDSLAIADLKIMDATNNDLTRYVTYNSFAFEPSECATYDIAKGYIYFEAPGTVKVATSVGGVLMADATLNNRISIDQAAAASVTLPSQTYTVGDTLNITDVKAFDKNGNELTDYSDMDFIIKDAAHFVGDSRDQIVLDKAGANTISVMVDGREGVAQVMLTPVMTVNPVAVAKVEIVGDYKVTDIITTAAVKAYAANGVEITSYAAAIDYSFEAGVAHAEDLGFMLDKSGDQNISVILSGNDIVPVTKVVVKNIAKCVASHVMFPGTENDEYRVGDVILKSDFYVYDAGGIDLTQYADISFTFAPASAATVNAQGNIEVQETGTFSIIVHVAGEVEDASFSKQYFVRHNVKDADKIYDIMVRPWSDEIMISNSDTLPEFVSYVWYRDEEVIAGQTTSIYNVQAEDADGQEHVYYAIAYDANGKQYLIAEKTYAFSLDAQTGNIVVVYPSRVSPAAPYTIETSVAGDIQVTNSNGSTMERFSVESGKNVVSAPMVPGVYVIHYVNAQGEAAMQKLIVK